MLRLYAQNWCNGSELPTGSFDIANCQDFVAYENDLFLAKASM
jgi:hypothetical protein